MTDAEKQARQQAADLVQAQAERERLAQIAREQMDQMKKDAMENKK